ncbi:MAG: hypothetical protein JOZ10_00895 [Acidobacteria bacterium]|nr:hypothetical protein [Acidobacteriota bacterium]
MKDWRLFLILRGLSQRQQGERQENPQREREPDISVHDVIEQAFIGTVAGRVRADRKNVAAGSAPHHTKVLKVDGPIGSEERYPNRKAPGCNMDP